MWKVQVMQLPPAETKKTGDLVSFNQPCRRSHQVMVLCWFEDFWLFVLAHSFAIVLYMIDDFPFRVRAGTLIVTTFEHHFFQEHMQIQYTNTINMCTYIYDTGLYVCISVVCSSLLVHLKQTHYSFAMFLNGFCWMILNIWQHTWSQWTSYRISSSIQFIDV